MAIEWTMSTLQRIPFWVFFIFAGLLWLGLAARKERVVRWRLPIIVPLALTIMSATSLWSQYGDTDLVLPSLLAWGTVCALVCWPFANRPLPENFQYQQETANFQLPGSNFPLAMYMGIFTFKFAVGFMSGIALPVVNDVYFVLGISCVYGLFSAVFLSNAWRLYRLRANTLQSN